MPSDATWPTFLPTSRTTSSPCEDERALTLQAQQEEVLTSERVSVDFDRGTARSRVEDTQSEVVHGSSHLRGGPEWIKVWNIDLST
jgi:hypothetical protein